MNHNDIHEIENRDLEGTKAMWEENFVLKKPIYILRNKRKYIASGNQGQNAIFFLTRGTKNISEKENRERICVCVYIYICIYIYIYIKYRIYILYIIYRIF